MSQETVVIDGSLGEGGGQVLRTALSLACLTGRRVQVSKVRAGRRNPGLAAQHLTALRSVAALCAGEVEGDSLGSTEVMLEPGRAAHGGEYSFDVAGVAEGGSAGSVSLLAQALVPPLALANGLSRLTLKGGTHVRWSPSFEYLEQVFLPRLAEIGIRTACHLEAWGFYPAGGGEIALEIEGVGPGASLRPREWIDRGPLARISGSAIASNLPAHIPQRMTDRARSLLAGSGARFAVTPRRVRGAGPGAGLFLVAEYEAVAAGFTAHGEPGKPSERLAEEAAEQLLAFDGSTAALDRHLSDQLLLPLALVPGRSAFTTPVVSEHLTTNALIIKQFLGSRIDIRQRTDGSYLVEVEGVDPRNQ